MGDRVALITGSGGEMGHGVLPRLRDQGFRIVALDLYDLPETLGRHCVETVRGDIRDEGLMGDLVQRFAPDCVYHLAAMLSAHSEAHPFMAHQVNVDATCSLLRQCEESAREKGRPVRFLFPSSIAVYGMPNAATKVEAGAVEESDWNHPRGMYGCNKLYIELFGTFLGRRAGKADEPGVDFRSIRFPGLISADTLPTGGTTDYAPEMIHAAAQGKPYSCFVDKDSRLPFMTMPDAVQALLDLAAAPPESLSTRVYNIRGFSPSPAEIRQRVLTHFPDAEIGFDPVPSRQAIVDSWPADVDDSRARSDWGLSPEHDLAGAIDNYLVPALRKRYSSD